VRKVVNKILFTRMNGRNLQVIAQLQPAIPKLGLYFFKFFIVNLNLKSPGLALTVKEIELTVARCIFQV
jgi:hypothetical protein